MMMVMVMVMMAVLAVMVMDGNSNERWRARRDDVTRIGCIYSGSSAHSMHTHRKEHPLGQTLQDTDVGSKTGRTSVKYCVPDVGDCAFDGCHSCDLIVDLQTLNSIPHEE